ncbi:MAG: hypothetical protein J0H57_10415 [Rhodospirillales bacterium]|nr:hypothetical protein [Rhodospirillales bacterium]
MTFGILDWTSNNLPPILKRYEQRDPESYQSLLGPLNLPTRNGCLDPQWTCDSNQQGRLMCDAAFHNAFSTTIKTAGFQKAQAEHALAAYERRLATYRTLGLQTEYGNVAMAVVANNLVNTPACKPATWKAACSDQVDERRLVNCMLDRYVANECRGSARGSEERRDEILRLFATELTADTTLPTNEAVLSCSADWGQ